MILFFRQFIHHKFFTRDVFLNFDDAYHFFNRYNTHSFKIIGQTRIDKFDYPDRVFREILANAIIHRDYAIADSDSVDLAFDFRTRINDSGF